MMNMNMHYANDMQMSRQTNTLMCSLMQPKSFTSVECIRRTDRRQTLRIRWQYANHTSYGRTKIVSLSTFKLFTISNNTIEFDIFTLVSTLLFVIYFTLLFYFHFSLSLYIALCLYCDE